MQNYFRPVFVLAAFLSAITLQSCHTSKPVQDTAILAEQQHNKKVVFKKPITVIDLRILDSDEITVLPNDFPAITDLLQKAHYDKKWNKTGMMVKMKTPDYSLAISSNGAEPTTVFFWTEGGRIKVGDGWYLLKKEDSAQLSAFLSKYKGGLK